MARRVSFGSGSKPVKSSKLAAHQALWGASSSTEGSGNKGSGKKRGGKGVGS
jgi:hypothetical protein